MSNPLIPPIRTPPLLLVRAIGIPAINSMSEGVRTTKYVDRRARFCITAEEVLATRKQVSSRQKLVLEVGRM